MNSENQRSYLNPYLAGSLLGLTLLASYAILGAGLGVSGALMRITAWFDLLLADGPESKYFAALGSRPLESYLLYMFAGVILGGFASALLNRRIVVQIERGRAYPPGKRLILALLGGIMVGFASCLARGCTSGLALTGAALLTTGGAAFLLATFAGGYLMAYFFRRQWHD
jgi:uncharacterized membrane protein YedE/YeeE